MTYFGQMVIAVEHLRKCRVIHGDITPENFVLDHKCNLKMIDFGIAQQLREGQHEIPWEQRGIYANHEYSARENEKGKPIGLSFDLYGLGAALRVMCTGRSEKISNYKEWRRQRKVKLGWSDCIVHDADNDDLSALNDLLTKLIGDRKGRTDCFENIWYHRVFEKFGGLNFRRKLVNGKVKHDLAVRRIIRQNVKDTLEDARATTDAKKWFGVFKRRRRLLPEKSLL